MEWETTDETMLNLAHRFKKLRKLKKISQQQLSKMSNVSYGTIKRFERTGEISLRFLIMLFKSLDVNEEINGLLSKNYYTDISEVIENEK